MRVLLLSEAGHEAERAAEDDRGAAGEAGVPHVGHLVQYSTVQYSTVHVGHLVQAEVRPPVGTSGSLVLREGRGQVP